MGAGGGAGRMGLRVGGAGWVVGLRVGVCTAVWALPARVWSRRSMPRELPDLPRRPHTAVQHVLSTVRSGHVRARVAGRHVVRISYNT